MQLTLPCICCCRHVEVLMSSAKGGAGTDKTVKCACDNAKSQLYSSTAPASRCQSRLQPWRRAPAPRTGSWQRPGSGWGQSASRRRPRSCSAHPCPAAANESRTKFDHSPARGCLSSVLGRVLHEQRTHSSGTCSMCRCTVEAAYLDPFSRNAILLEDQRLCDLQEGISLFSFFCFFAWFFSL